jgi:hypothetical protein
VFIVTVSVREVTPEGDEVIRVGKLYLVDLAGSENITRWVDWCMDMWGSEGKGAGACMCMGHGTAVGWGFWVMFSAILFQTKHLLVGMYALEACGVWCGVCEVWAGVCLWLGTLGGVHRKGMSVPAGVPAPGAYHFPGLVRGGSLNRASQPGPCLHCCRAPDTYPHSFHALLTAYFPRSWLPPCCRLPACSLAQVWRR